MRNLVFLMLTWSSCLSLAGEKIQLDPSMFTLERGLGDPGRLADEQTEVGDPRAGTGLVPKTRWGGDPDTLAYPYRTIVDLGQTYQLEAIWLFNRGVAGKVVFMYGEPGNWQTFFGDRLEQPDVWYGRSVNVTTRYLRIARGAAIFDEMVVYGSPVNSDLPIVQIPFSPNK